MDSTMGGGQLPPMQKQRNGRQHEMDVSSNHNGRRRRDCNGWRQQQLATAAHWAVGWRRDRDERWDGGGTMDSTMGSHLILIPNL
jgi:hypothetical protein